MQILGKLDALSSVHLDGRAQAIYYFKEEKLALGVIARIAEDKPPSMLPIFAVVKP